MEPQQVDELKRRLCAAARDELMARYKRVETQAKADGSIVTEADLAMQNRVQTEISELFPDYSFLGEEMSTAECQAQLNSPGAGVWVLDPLDGTSNFASGIPYFAVSLALLGRSGVELGLVFDPMRDELFHAQAGQGAWLNGKVLGRRARQLPLRSAIGLVDFKRLSTELAQRLAASPPYASQRSFGSVALDFCWLAAGRGHLYLHGRHKLWDYAAGLTILREAGGHAITLEGRENPPLDLTPRSTAASLDGALFREWCEWLGINS